MIIITQNYGEPILPIIKKAIETAKTKDENVSFEYGDIYVMIYPHSYTQDIIEKVWSKIEIANLKTEIQ